MDTSGTQRPSKGEQGRARPSKAKRGYARPRERNQGGANYSSIATLTVESTGR